MIKKEKKNRIEKIISKVLEYIRDHALNSFEETWLNYTSNDIR